MKLKLPKLQRVQVELVPTDQVPMCPMGPSLAQKEADGTITPEEAQLLQMLRLHGMLVAWENEDAINKLQ